MTLAPTSVPPTSVPPTSMPPSSIEAAPTRGERLRPILFIAGVFLFGAIAGAAGSRAYSLNERRPAWGNTPSARAQVRVDAMKRSLDLTEGQAKSIETIVLETEQERETVMAPCKAGMDEWRERSDTRIREVLSPSQKTEFDELRQRWRGSKK